MPTYSTSTPAQVIRQEDEPSAADYLYWIKPSTSQTYYSDGSVWISLNLVGLPIGSIICWAKSFGSTPSLGDDWVECNGQLVEDEESPYNGLNLPNLNDEKIEFAGTNHYGGVDSAWSNVNNAFDLNSETYASKFTTNTGSAYIGKTFTERIITYVYLDRNCSGSLAAARLEISYDGSNWETLQNLSVSSGRIAKTIPVFKLCMGVRFIYDVGTADRTTNVYRFDESSEKDLFKQNYNYIIKIK